MLRLILAHGRQQPVPVGAIVFHGPRDRVDHGVGEARLFADTGALFANAYPDGPIVDAEDHVWTGMYLGGCVARFSPDGELVGTWKMPARDITKMALGGDGLKTPLPGPGLPRGLALQCHWRGFQ